MESELLHLTYILIDEHCHYDEVGNNPVPVVDCLHVLLENGGDSNAVRNDQSSPVHLAASGGHLRYVQLVKWLLGGGGGGERERQRERQREVSSSLFRGS